MDAYSIKQKPRLILPSQLESESVFGISMHFSSGSPLAYHSTGDEWIILFCSLMEGACLDAGPSGGLYLVL